MPHPLCIIENLVVPEAQNRIALSVEICSALRVAHALCMLSAIDFNYQRRFTAGEVSNIGPNWQLPYELVPIKLPAPKHAPEAHFRIGAVVAQ